MKLKLWVQIVLMSIVTLIVFGGMLSLFHAMYVTDKENAIKRCGGESNIVEKRTNQGDIYFNCKQG